MVKLVFGCLQYFSVFRMFDISKVCPGKAGFRMFAALFDFSDVCYIGCLPWKSCFSDVCSTFCFFGCLTYRMFALEMLLFGCLQHLLVFRMFEISDVCPGKAGFRMFAAIFGISDV